MLHTEYRRERSLQPERHQPLGVAAGVWRIRNDEIVAGLAERLGETDCILAMNRHSVCRTKCLEIASEDGERPRHFLHEINRRGAAGQALEPECAGAGKKVEHPGSGDVHLENAHPRLSHAVEGGAHGFVRGSLDSPSPPFSRDDSHSLKPGRSRGDVGDARLKPALPAKLIALESECDVYYRLRRELRSAVGQSPADCFELT